MKWIVPRGAALWLWSHRTKVIGGTGLAAGYAYSHQAELGVFIPVAKLAHFMMGIGVITFAVGLYNTIVHGDDSEKQ